MPILDNYSNVVEAAVETIKIRICLKMIPILLAITMAATMTLLGATPASAQPLEVWVDDDWAVSSHGDPVDGHTFGTDAFATIQDGIDAVASPGSVHVAAGTYIENITLKDGVEVLGAGADVTTIDGGGSGSVVTANNVGSGTKLDGFTITNGNATNGGGMYNNRNSSPVVSNCTFSGNSATETGGGMYNNCNSSPTVTNCTFSGNSGYGMYDYNSSPVVTNCIFWENAHDQEIYNSNSTPVVTYCDIQGGYSGTGNIDADPLFVNPAADNYHLQSGSPCIDTGDNTAVPSWLTTDFEGDPRIVDGDGDSVAVVDMGADEYVVPPTLRTWLAKNITSNSAKLRGYLVDLGEASSVEVSFEWGTTTAYGNETPPQIMDAAGV